MIKANGWLKLIPVSFLVTASLALTGCATLNKLMGRNKSKNANQVADGRPPAPKFSEQENFNSGTQRQYKRMTKDRFEKDSQVGAGEGSLWVMEGQGSYLFAQNNNHIVGDILTVNIDGPPKQQLQTKVKVITKLLDRLDRPDTSLMRGPTSIGAGAQAPGAATAAAPGASAAPGADPAAAAPADASVAQAAKPKDGDGKFDVETVPARIVEILKDGSYRVQGAQAFMIGRREYKTIVSGIVRPGDFNEDGTPASKMLDGQFDVVSSKKGMAAL